MRIGESEVNGVHVSGKFCRAGLEGKETTISSV